MWNLALWCVLRTEQSGMCMSSCLFLGHLLCYACALLITWSYRLQTEDRLAPRQGPREALSEHTEGVRVCLVCA